MSANLLELDGVRAFYGARQVLFGVDLHVPAGGVVALLGANGAGKTTTLRALCGMVRTEGNIRFAGEAVRGRRPDQMVRRGIGHVPDGRGTFLALSVEENLRLGAYTRRDRAGIAADMGRIYGYFPRLEQRLRQQAGTLSGGEQQMLAISRALMLRPRLLVLDEPSFGLAPMIVQEIFAILGEINRREGMAMLVVEQNARLALDLADQAFLLETGAVVMHGDAAALRDNENVRRAYLGY